MTRPSTAGNVRGQIAVIVTVLIAAVLVYDSPRSGAATQTSSPVADAYVSAAKPTNNYGASTNLRSDGSPMVRSYLRFDAGSTASTLVRAEVRVYANSTLNAPITASSVSTRAWDERTITYANAPVVGAPIAQVANAVRGQWMSFDVTAAAKAGAFSLALTTSSSTALAMASREDATHAPQLVVTVPEAATTTTAPATTTTAAPPPPPAADDVQPSFPIAAGFYYPWFPEAWSQQGINPFTWYHPTAGLYDGSSSVVVTSQVEQMRRAGLSAGIASWWGQASRTDGRIRTLLDVAAATPAAAPFRWSLYYENEAANDPSVAQIQADLTYIRDHYGNDPGFLRVDGKFVVFVYAGAADACGMADRWKQANTVGAYVVLKVFAGYKTCASQPDSWHQYGPAVSADSQAPYSYTISPGFWLRTDSAPRLVRDLARWDQDVRSLAAAAVQWRLVTTFNEWGEGTSVEPASEWASGSGLGSYIDTLAAVLAPVTPPPTVRSSGGTTTTTTATTAPTTTTTVTPPTGDRLVMAAGDIACDPSSGDFRSGAGTATACRQVATSNLLMNEPALDGVITLGDNQYESGTLSAFLQSYDPSWGRLKGKTRPAVGNHEYLSPGAAGYYQYFGAAAGDPAKGYYSYDIGAWHFIALNSNCSQVGGCGAGSPQEQWLRADLAAHPTACTAAYWHHPRFSSGQHGANTSVQPLWNALYAARADLVLSGHDHDYERFAPQTPAGVRDDALGIRQFVVGTGGKNHYGITAPTANSEFTNTTTYGVLRLVLHASSYDWRFVAEDGTTLDAGATACH